ncbi:MAG: hypothetical protein WA071_26420 [Undibacterium umbellatum]|uniref:hypothetical protein n=1 Tax=Undibacterium umbellatum TaxID=2762300 RepID=UPI003BB5687E
MSEQAPFYQRLGFNNCGLRHMGMLLSLMVVLSFSYWIWGRYIHPENCADWFL